MRRNSSIGVNLILGMLIIGSLGLMYNNQTSFEDQNILNFDDREFEVEESGNRVKVIIEGGDQPMNIDLPAIREDLGIPNNIKLDLILSGQNIIEDQILNGDSIELSLGTNSIIRNNTISNIKIIAPATSSYTEAFGIKVLSSANVTVVNNTISNIAASAATCIFAQCDSKAAGIWLHGVSGSNITNNIINNIVSNSTFKAPNSAYGVYSYWAYNNTYSNNVITNIFAETDNIINEKVAPKAYGFYAFSSDSGNGKLNFSNNVVNGINAKLHITIGTASTPIAASHGIYLKNTNDTNIVKNRFENINSVVTQDQHTSTARAQSYGVYLQGTNWLDRLNISGNSFATINSTSYPNGVLPSAVPVANSWGIFSESSSKPRIDAVIENNQFNGIYAQGNQIATTIGIDLDNYIVTKIANNQFENLNAKLINSLDGQQFSKKQTTVNGIHVTRGLDITVLNNNINSLVSDGDDNSAIRSSETNGIWISGTDSIIIGNTVQGIYYNHTVLVDSFVHGHGIRIDGNNGLIQNNEITGFGISQANGGHFYMKGIVVGPPDATSTLGSNDTEVLSNVIGSGISHNFQGIRVAYSYNTQILDNVVFGTEVLPTYDYQGIVEPKENFEIYFFDGFDSTIRAEKGLMSRIAWFGNSYYNQNLTVNKDGAFLNYYEIQALDAPLIIDTGNLAVGAYNYQVELTSGGLLTTFGVTITGDNSAPYVSQLPDLTFEQGILPKSIGWSAKDGSPTTYRILRNNVEMVTGTWTSNVPVVYDISSLNIGIYNFTIEFTDAGGRKTSSSLTLTMLSDTNPPVLLASSFDTLSSALGRSLSIFFNASDNHPSTYVIYENGTQIISAGWLNDVSITQLVNTSISALFNYTIVIFDGNGESVSKTIMVSVNPDTTAPTIGHNGHLSFVSGDTGKTITFFITELNGGNYTLYQDDVSVDTGVLTGEETIVTWGVSYLDPGTYNFTITVMDSVGNFGWIYLLVTVSADTLPPSIVWNPNFIMTEGDTNQYVTFTGWDDNPGTYELYMDDVLVESGTWVSAAEIKYSLDGLVVGSYNFRMEISDLAGNTVTADTWVNVLAANTEPTTTNDPTDTNSDTFSEPFNGDEGDDSAGFLPSPPVNILAILMMYLIVNVHRRKKK